MPEFVSVHDGSTVCLSDERTYWHSDAVSKGYPVDDRAEVRTQVPVGEVVAQRDCPFGGPLDRPSANLVSSRRADGRHMPALDLDYPATLVASSSEGHCHLLIDKPMRWWRYRLLLWVLAFCGLIERRYYRHSVRRGMTMLRLPHVRKGEA